MILKSLEDLDRYTNLMINSKNIVTLKDINKVSEGGGESTNTYNNKLFYWNFQPYYIQELVQCYEELAKVELTKYRLKEFKNKIIKISNKMIYKDICPIEAILYASKSVNYLLYNELLINTLGDIISQIYIYNEGEYKDTILFILNEWSWNLQIIVLINACGKIGDIDFLNIIYEKYTKDDTRLESLKAFMNVNNDICMDYSLKVISQIKESDNIEVQMVRYFVNNFNKSFGELSIKKAEKYLIDENINKQAKKAISKVIPRVSKVEGITLNSMIKIAKNWENEDFKNLFTKWMKDDVTRKNAFLAMRYSNHKDVETMIIDTLNNYKCSSIEIGTAIISLAQCGTRKGIGEKFFELVNKYKNDTSIKVYCNAAMCSIGDENNSIELIEEFLEKKYYDRGQIFSLIRDCTYKSIHLIKIAIRKVYMKYLNSGDRNKIQKAINGAYELCYNPKLNFSNIVLPEIKKIINISMKNGVELSEEIYIDLINFIERLINDKNKDEFIDILFSIIENKFCSSKIKSKSIIMLKRLKVDPPR